MEKEERKEEETKSEREKKGKKKKKKEEERNGKNSQRCPSRSTTLDEQEGPEGARPSCSNKRESRRAWRMLHCVLAEVGVGVAAGRVVVQQANRPVGNSRQDRKKKEWAGGRSI